MQGLRLIYAIYVNYYQTKIDEINDTLHTMKQARLTVYNFLKKNELIFIHSNTHLNEFIKYKDIRKVKHISFTGKVHHNLAELLKQNCEDLVESNKRIAKLTAKREKIKDVVVCYEIFKEVIRMYNKAKVNLLITKGYTWNLGNGLGNINIALKEIPVVVNDDGYIKQRINWPASKANKKRLKAAGIPVYDKEKCPEGEKWFVCYTDEVMAYFGWSNANRMYVANVRDMRFKPTLGENGICTKLARYRREHPEVDDRYINKL